MTFIPTLALIKNSLLVVGTYNVRGLSDKLKTRRILNYVACKKFDRLIYSFQETHITESRRSELEHCWRGEFLWAPGESNARGVLTLYNTTLFDQILYKFGNPNGRSTWLAGTVGGLNELFVSIYSPNNGKNKEFYIAFLKEVKNICTLYNIDNIYILGDLNVNLHYTNTVTKSKNKLLKAILKELRNLELEILSDKPPTNTWNHGNKFSTLDYVIVSKHLSKFAKSLSTIWG